MAYDPQTFRRAFNIWERNKNIQNNGKNECRKKQVNIQETEKNSEN